MLVLGEAELAMVVVEGVVVVFRRCSRWERVVMLVRGVLVGA
jgi:hypothetical protein